MKYILTPEQSTEFDQFFIQKQQIPSLVLMEQAATAVAGAVMRITPPSKVLILCATGNNGGDGWASGRILLMHGYQVVFGITGYPATPDAIANMRYFEEEGPIHVLNEENAPSFFEQHKDATVIIDALFGTGLNKPLEGIFLTLASLINRHPAKVVSVDIPSGISGKTGQGDGAVKANVTVTFQYPKPGHFIYPGRAHTGELMIAKIAPDPVIQLPDALFHVDTYALPKRKQNSNKGMYGKLAILAGSKGMTGAANFTCRAALALGAGLTTLFSCPYVIARMQEALPEVMGIELGAEDMRVQVEEDISFLSGYHAAAVGPGLGCHGDLLPFITNIASLDMPKVLDADALNILAKQKDPFQFGENTVITPHPKEFARLTKLDVDAILRDPVDVAAKYSLQHHVIVLLKGATTIVANGKQTAFITAGSPSMAKGGSGDVLTGAIAALLAQGIPAFEAAYGAAYLCGAAGEKANAEKGDYAPLASDTIDHLCP